VHAFIDMHDLGDMLLAAGFAAPVMDMEIVTFVYQGQDCSRTCARAARPARAPIARAGLLLAARDLQSLRDALPAPATLEVIYGHAWAGALRKAREQTVKTIGVFKRILETASRTVVIYRGSVSTAKPRDFPGRG